MKREMMINISHKRKKDWLDNNINDVDLINALNEGAIDVRKHPKYHKFRDRIKDKEVGHGKDEFYYKTYQTSKNRATEAETYFKGINLDRGTFFVK